VPVAIDGVKCGATTLGHRFHHPGQITIGGAHDYVEKLRACHVIVDQDEREATVRKGAFQAAEDAGYFLVEDEGLLVENAGLTSLPVPLLGSFDPDFLDVPEEVIQLTARINQKYFVMRDPAGKLAPHFVCVANIDANDGGEAIVAGNERVLAARLSDARFFWEHDLKVPLEEQAKKLGQIVFHEKLGTVAEKVERVAKLARWLVVQGIVKGADPDQAERAARLAKADLVTGMVGEFPELQGVIGGYLARAQGEPDAVADAVRDHYKPVGQGDGIPTEPVTVAVSLADKLDSVAAFFANDLKPSGSKDPYALRRAALGILGIFLENRVRIPLRKVFAATWLPASMGQFGEFERLHAAQTMQEVYENGPSKFFDEAEQAIQNLSAGMPAAQAERAVAEANDKLAKRRAEFQAGSAEFLDFFADRLKVQQRDAGVRYDLIDAVFALGGEDDPVRLLARVDALQKFVETPEGADLLAAYKRAANILKKEKWEGKGAQNIAQTGDEDPLVLVEDPVIALAVAESRQSTQSGDSPTEEQALVTALDSAEPKAIMAIVDEDFTAAMAALATLRGPIDAFFDNVTVNDPETSARARRLNLLARFRDAVNAVADFSKIEG